MIRGIWTVGGNVIRYIHDGRYAQSIEYPENWALMHGFAAAHELTQEILGDADRACGIVLPNQLSVTRSAIVFPKRVGRVNGDLQSEFS